MEPLSIASGLGTVVALMGLFKQLRAADAHANVNDFLEWLDKHNFEDIRSWIEGSQDRLMAIEEILLGNHHEVMTALGSMNSQLGAISDQLNTLFSSPPNEDEDTLSQQALEILKWLSDSDSTFFFVMRMRHGTTLQLEKGGSVSVEETPYLQDDLDALVVSGFLRGDFKGNAPKYYRTRRGDSYIESL